ncbi:hypothetical protein [Comamonas testosteroni]|nr:hypothetical protein [Comamonas testosteroni]
MQDKIPDALIAAFERHYDADWNLNQLRNERLAWRAAWAEATKPCLHQITEPQAAPEAAAVPDEREAFEKWASFVGYSIKRWQADANLYEDNGTEDAWIAWQARAALAATPAAAARLSRAEAAITIRNLKREIAEKEAAAPVVLPEPDAYMDSEDAHRVETSSDWVVTGDRRAPDDVALYTASTVRALLATATGLPAHAVPAFCHVASLKLKNLQERGYQITGYAIEKPVEGAQPERGFINHGGFVGWWWDGQSPMVQPGAFDALTPAARDVLAERQRQITQEGYDPQHDDDHVNDEIAAMAALFIMPEGSREWDATSTSYGDTLAEALLPGDWEMPNFGDDRRRQLIKGTAMGLAEIERIDRAAIAATKGE